jgi:hypothetical protein
MGDVTDGRAVVKLDSTSPAILNHLQRRTAVSIVRVGLGETKNFAEGYEAIFGKKEDKKKAESASAAEQAQKDEPKEEKK